MFDLDKIPLNDKETYAIICTGKTKGCFQAESHLVQSYCKKLKPKNEEELAAIIAGVRPGSLPFLNDYIAVKDGLKDPEYLFPELEPILSKTFGVMLYQEQLLEIGQKIAGYTEAESDINLRKPVGKKDLQKLKEVGPDFIKRCVKNCNISEEKATTLFEILKLSGSYLFNRSHAFCYQRLFYISAYLKCHYPTIFYYSCLRCAKQKQKPLEEIRELYYDMKDFGINLVPPTIKKPSIDFDILDKTTIAFGFSSIKGVGEKCKTALKDLKAAKNWKDALFVIISKNVAKTKVEPFIKSGALDCYGETRNKMLFEFELIKSLSSTQRKLLLENNEFWKDGSDFDLINCIYMIFEQNKRLKMSDTLIEQLEKYKVKSFKDSSLTKDIWERQYLGINITSSRVDEISDEDVTHDCSMINSQETGDGCFVAVLDSMNRIKTREKKEDMAFLDVTDLSGKVSGVVVFPKVFNRVYFERFLLRDVGNETLKITGYKKNGSFIAEDIVHV